MIEMDNELFGRLIDVVQDWTIDKGIIIRDADYDYLKRNFQIALGVVSEKSSPLKDLEEKEKFHGEKKFHGERTFSLVAPIEWSRYDKDSGFALINYAGVEFSIYFYKPTMAIFYDHYAFKEEPHFGEHLKEWFGDLLAT